MAVTSKPLNLLEWAKLARDSGDDRRADIIDTYTGSSYFLQFVPFKLIPTGVYKYDSISQYSGIAFRGINETFTKSHGVINPQTENTSILGGRIEIDRVLRNRPGGDRTAAIHEEAQLKAQSLVYVKTFFKGDSEADPREFDGLQKRLTGSQLLTTASPSNGGDALKLSDLRRLVYQVEGNNKILVMNKTMFLLISDAQNDTSVSGYFQTGHDNFGNSIKMFDMVPMVWIDLDNEENEILPFSEANPGGGTAASTSIYCISFDEDKTQGLQEHPPRNYDLRSAANGPIEATEVEWPTGLTLQHKRSAARLSGIKNAAVTK